MITQGSSIQARRSKETITSSSRPLIASKTSCLSEHLDPNERDVEFEGRSRSGNLSLTIVSSNEDYFASHSKYQIVRFVRDKLDKIRSSGVHLPAG